MKPSLALLEFILSCSDFFPCMVGFAFTSPTESCFPHLSQLLPEPSREHRSNLSSYLCWSFTWHILFVCTTVKCLNCSLKWGFRILPSASWFHIFILTTFHRFYLSLDVIVVSLMFLFLWLSTLKIFTSMVYFQFIFYFFLGLQIN